MFLPLSVCLSVCLCAGYLKNLWTDADKIWGTRTNWFDFGEVPDPNPDTRVFLNIFSVILHHWEIRPKRRPKSIGAALCTEQQCCWSSLLGYWAQSWMGHHSDAGNSNGSIIPANWHSFRRPRKDDRLSQPHLELIQQPTGTQTQDPRTSSPPR